MKILWLSWKDPSHPEAGGAEVVQRELTQRLVKDGHEVVVLCGGYKGGKRLSESSSYTVIRLGGRFTVYLYAYFYYRKHLKGWADVIIDEVNTAPFFARWYPREKKEKVILLIHQLARQIWFHQMYFPLSWVGYLLLEPMALLLQRNSQVITVSESTKRDLMRFGFKKENINIISEGVELLPLSELTSSEKFKRPTVLALGSIRPMKRTHEIVEAFMLLKKMIPNAHLILAGDQSGSYASSLMAEIERSPIAKDIRVLGRVSRDEKTVLMQKSQVLALASLKEGWGLVVTEAASQGTPAAVYNVDGLRDSVRDEETGLIATTNTPQGLADVLARLLLNPQEYTRMRYAAWAWSHEITFEKSYQDFLLALKSSPLK